MALIFPSELPQGMPFQIGSASGQRINPGLRKTGRDRLILDETVKERLKGGTNPCCPPRDGIELPKPPAQIPKLALLLLVLLLLLGLLLLLL